jgi:hypothetical protein
MQLNIRAVKGLLELWVDKAAVALANFGWFWDQETDPSERNSRAVRNQELRA